MQTLFYFPPFLPSSLLPHLPRWGKWESVGGREGGKKACNSMHVEWCRIKSHSEFEDKYKIDAEWSEIVNTFMDKGCMNTWKVHTAYHEDCGQSDRVISITCTEWLQKVKHRKLKKELSGPYRPARPVVPFPALNLLQPLGITMTLTFMNSLIYFPTQDKVKEYIAYISWTVKIKIPTRGDAVILDQIGI